MISFFKRKQKPLSPEREAAAERAASHLVRLQMKWAAYMHRSVNGWTTAQKKLALFLFLLLIGANSGVALYQVFNKKNGKGKMIIDGKMKVPRLDHTSVAISGSAQRAYFQLMAYRAYLDSLRTDSTGVHLFEKLRAERPGLIDGIETLTEPFSNANHE